MPSTFTQGNLEDTTKHVDRWNKFFHEANQHQHRKGEEQNTEGFFLTNLQLACCFKQDTSIELKPREEVEEFKRYYYVPQVITDYRLTLGNQKVNGWSPKPRQVKSNQEAGSRGKKIVTRLALPLKNKQNWSWHKTNLGLIYYCLKFKNCTIISLWKECDCFRLWLKLWHLVST